MLNPELFLPFDSTIKCTSFLITSILELKSPISYDILRTFSSLVFHFMLAMFQAIPFFHAFIAFEMKWYFVP